ncbi:MAG: hypothetical protein M3X11_11060 [Acidobacteriota bacterium]|nr:hypothetical protein [Acidobacteriota bacterium]
MRRYSTVALLIVLTTVCAFPLASIAQKKSTGARKRPAAKPTPTPVPDTRVEAGQVAEQIKNFSKFIYVYGKVVNGLAVAEDQVKQGKMSPAAATQNQQSKDALVQNIRNLKAGVEGVTRDFQNNSRLQIQYLKIAFAVDAAGDAERLAAAGRYDEAGKSLVTVIERLTDTVMAMR